MNSSISRSNGPAIAIIAIVCYSLFAYGCITPRKYESFVTRNYPAHLPQLEQPASNIIIKTDSLSSLDKIAKVTKGNTYFIPALFYWGIKESYNCRLNNKIPANILSTTFRKYADSLHITDRLSGKRLEIDITSIPSEFAYLGTEDIIFVLFFAVTVGQQRMIPLNSSLTANYRLYDGNRLLKDGKISVANSDKTLSNPWKSRKGITAKYLEQYERNLQKMTQQFVRKLGSELLY